MQTPSIPPSRPPASAAHPASAPYAAPPSGATGLPRDAVLLGPIPAALRHDAAPLPPAPPVVRQAAPSAIPSVPQTLFEETPTPSVWELLEANNPDLMQGEPDAASLPANLPRVTPTEAVRFVPEGGTTLNTGSTFFVTLPNIGRAVAKHETGNGRANTHCEALAAAFDLHLPKIDGAPDRLVPRTGIAYVEQPFSTRVKDGRPAHDAPKGLYSFQAFVDDAVEYRHAKTGFHPQYVRMAFLDALGDNWDRNVGNWLVSRDGAPHCHDNGSLFHTMGGFVEDMGYGWSLRDAGVITKDNERQFLTQSLEYALKAQAALTDEVIADEVGRIRAVPHYRNVDFDGLAARARELRDKIPHLIEARLGAI